MKECTQFCTVPEHHWICTRCCLEIKTSEEQNICPECYDRGERGWMTLVDKDTLEILRSNRAKKLISRQIVDKKIYMC
jgi:hypothetical protein